VDIRPIRTARDHRRALARLDELWGAPEGSPEADEAEILITLIAAYEEKHHPIDPPDPIEAIQFRMEQQGLTRADLEPWIGSRARVAEVLNRRRPLTLPMIRRLRDALGISADILIGSSSPRHG